MIRALFALVLMTMAVSPGTSPLRTVTNKAALGEFRDFVPQFVAAWDSQDFGKIGDLVDPSIGFWVIYNFGIESRAYHFQQFSKAISDGEHGFGYLSAARFGSCHPKPGAVAKCQTDGKLPLCRFGKTEPSFLTIFDAQIESAKSNDEKLLFEKERALVRSSVEQGLYFLSDDQWGTIFYFVRGGERWKLLVVDTSDCSA